ncbi:MAG: hypothetical protein QN178_01830 [Armatimonadota bacterium]|nr:hypothetical protein [Armatimonadota bacterium]
MRVLAALLSLVMFVTVVAVNGSRAQPLPGASTAYLQCAPSEAAPVGRCLPIVTLRAGFDEFGADTQADQITAGDGYGSVGQSTGEEASDPELLAQLALRALEALVIGFFGELGTRLAERAAGTAHLPETDVELTADMFDPVTP